MSDNNLRVDCQRLRRTLAAPFNGGANAAPVSEQTLPVQCHYSVCTSVVALKQPTKEFLTLVLSREMNGVTLSIVTLGTIRPRDREPCFVVKKTWTSGHGGESPGHAKNPLLGE